MTEKFIYYHYGTIKPENPCAGDMYTSSDNKQYLYNRKDWIEIGVIGNGNMSLETENIDPIKITTCNKCGAPLKYNKIKNGIYYCEYCGSPYGKKRIL